MYIKKIQFCLFLCFLFSMVSSARALDWKDDEWREGGCPQDIEGTWIAESQSPFSGQEIEFRRDGTLLIVRSGRDLVLSVKRDKKSTDGRYVEVEIQSRESGYPPYIKIRPHLVSSQGATCQIKLFRYDSAAHARQNRESGWDIYRRMN